MNRVSKLEIVYKNLFPALLLYAIKWLNDEDAAKDVVQAVFVKLLDSKYKPSDYKSYLFKSIRNTCINQLKSKSNQFSEIKENHVSYFRDPIEEAEFEAYVFKLISELPNACQNIFKLNRFEGLTNQQIADKLNISKRTVELQISNALSYLRKEIYNPQNPYSNYLLLLF
ncbi:MAG: sigma-70 family RNA polymerase sigma factor [Marinifilaceae bacterium]|jgi:RNA polymerase sigma-70 factor (ECF subfamily)|nr:sigma-70 family RNA polymerase sigma factor [Marinifilaceae bacterium]